MADIDICVHTQLAQMARNLKPTLRDMYVYIYI